MATFVLVHGGFHGGWCWSKVAARLRSRGHGVFTPTLTGLGERSHLMSPAVNLTTHIVDIVNVLRWERLTDVILCGHSYGCMVITGVADRELTRVRRLVYLDGTLAKNGESLFDQYPDEYVRGIITKAVRQSDGYRMVVPDPATHGVQSAEDLAWVKPLLTPQPLPCLLERLALTHPEPLPVPKTYVCATRAVPSRIALRDELAARPDWRTLSIDSTHDVMIDRPVELADLLDDEARVG